MWADIVVKVDICAEIDVNIDLETDLNIDIESELDIDIETEVGLTLECITKFSSFTFLLAFDNSISHLIIASSCIASSNSCNW